MSRLERIVAACGGILLDGGRRALIPGPDHSNKDRSVSLAETEDGRVLIHCFSPKDDWRGVRRALTERGLLDREASTDAKRARWSLPTIVAQPATEQRRARAQRIWNECRPIAHTPATSYLRRRAIPEELWRTPALRFHPRMTSLDDRVRRPALVAGITDVAGELQGVQVTLLTAYGMAKAPVPTARRVIGDLAGGLVRLGDPEHELAIGEGVETMLSASHALGVPAWAALTADNLARFVPPSDLKRLILAHDRDAAGQAACEVLRARLDIPIDTKPPPSDNDWNGWAQRIAKASGAGA